jgi:hypothetical protein
MTEYRTVEITLYSNIKPDVTIARSNGTHIYEFITRSSTQRLQNLIDSSPHKLFTNLFHGTVEMEFPKS